MKFQVYGFGHLADTLLCELQLRGVAASEEPTFCSLGFVAEDITDHEDGAQLHRAVEAFAYASRQCRTVVVVSQVPPGWTRMTADGRQGVYYQVDTIIVKNAIERMMRPEQIIVGCADPSEPLPLEYQAYLALHDCPVLQMSYESAELAKCAINYALAQQINTANVLAYAARACGADYDDVARALRGDLRIGPHAYLRPGEANQHLKRDVATIQKQVIENGSVRRSS